MRGNRRWMAVGLSVAIAFVAGACTTEPLPEFTGANLEPVAVAAATPISGPAPLDVAFSAAGSYDSDGTISFYEWNFGDSSPVTNVKNPSHTYTAPGSYVASLIVTDGYGATGFDTVTIEVLP